MLPSLMASFNKKIALSLARIHLSNKSYWKNFTARQWVDTLAYLRHIAAWAPITPGKALKRMLVNLYLNALLAKHEIYYWPSSRIATAIGSSKTCIGRYIHGLYCRSSFLPRQYSNFRSGGSIFKSVPLRHVTHHFYSLQNSWTFHFYILSPSRIFRSIISDRDILFLSNFWRTLFKLHRRNYK